MTIWFNSAVAYKSILQMVKNIYIYGTYITPGGLVVG